MKFLLHHGFSSCCFYSGYSYYSLIKNIPANANSTNYFLLHLHHSLLFPLATHSNTEVMAFLSWWNPHALLHTDSTLSPWFVALCFVSLWQCRLHPRSYCPLYPGFPLVWPSPSIANLIHLHHHHHLYHHHLCYHSSIRWSSLGICCRGGWGLCSLGSKKWKRVGDDWGARPRNGLRKREVDGKGREIVKYWDW